MDIGTASFWGSLDHLVQSQTASSDSSVRQVRPSTRPHPAARLLPAGVDEAWIDGVANCAGNPLRERDSGSGRYWARNSLQIGTFSRPGGTTRTRPAWAARVSPY